MPKQGDIVLVPFPFTDLSNKKVRPALVLGNYRDDITVCFISSVLNNQNKSTDVIVNISKVNGLKAMSNIKVMKIATLDKKVILGKLGKLEKEYILKVKIIIKKYLCL